MQIRNNGEIVEGYRIEVVGAPANWVSVEPDTVSLYPGSSTTATLSFRPPRSADVPAGEQQFGVVVIPTEHPDEAVVPEGVVEVLPFFDTTAELLPRTSQGRWRGRHQVAVDNRGNVPLTIFMQGSDPADMLDFKVRPSGETVAPGHASFTGLKVRPVKRLWRGAPVTHPFTVQVTPADGQPVTLDGTHLQQPMFPPWLGKALLALLSLLLVLAALWFLLLKPTIESAAEEAVAQPVAEAKEQAKAAQAGAEKADDSAGAAQQSAGDAQEILDDIEEQTGEDVPARTIVSPLAERLEVSAPARQDDSAAFTVPRGTTVTLTDLVLSNPQGDFGRVAISLDDRVLFDMALENFRDIDYHFVSPIRADAGQALTVTMNCHEVGVPPAQEPPPEECSTAVFFGGEAVRAAPERAEGEQRPSDASPAAP